MQRSDRKILTTHPGRLPNPDNYADVHAARSADDQAKFREQGVVGIQEMVAKQKEIGIDILSDGEFWKGRDQKYYDSRVTGIKARPLQTGEVSGMTGMLRERSMPEFKGFYEIYDRVGNTPRPGVINPPHAQRYSIVGEVKGVNSGAIAAEIDMVKAGIAAAGESVENFF